MKEILDGWMKVLIEDEETEKLSKERMTICNSCPFKSKIIGVEVCSRCNCPLIAKTRSKDSSCPKGFWNKADNNI